ncbi:unnamed protein product [Phytophthora fragariaefolia]|uniref:Unnamed protein product n=1 Tax=Phytophthora fragariaefolia TaxID=1490495 RepID=A0A9W7CU87_9STRA|nr:unnamed protein product [Phytophthora fragariaefolia]
MIKDNYATVYSRIGHYYAGGCHDFLPLCWFHALVNDSSETTDMLDIPDPNENLIGFYLVPRQMQFPEQDDYFLQEIVSSIQTEAELTRLQQVHAAFQQVAFRAPAKGANAAALKSAMEGIQQRATTDLVNIEEVSQQHANLLQWLGASLERTISWNELLTWCCTDMNANEMLNRFGADACRAVEIAFQKLAIGIKDIQYPKDHVKTYVWEPGLVGTILSHPHLPGELKENIQRLSATYFTRLELPWRKMEATSPANNASKVSNSLFDLNDGALSRPWEHLLRLELPEIHLISWSVFLSKWRQSADSKCKAYDVQVYHQNERRHNSVNERVNPSVLVARKNALATMTPNHRIFHSFRDLNQLRQQLPLIASRSSDIEESFELPPSTDRLFTVKSRLSEIEELELTENRKIFRSLQQSPTNLDELTKQLLEQKRVARCNAHERAAENRKKAAQLVVQRQQELERVKHDRQVKVQERVRRRDRWSQILTESRQERHQRAQWWKQNRLEAEITRQKEYMQQLQDQRDAAKRLEQAMIQTQRSNSEPWVKRLSTASLPQPSSSPTRDRQLSCPRRPQSARTADPQIVRGRAHVYGCAATKAFAARRPQTVRADLPSGSRSPRSKQQSANFRRRTRPVVDRGSGSSQNQVVCSSTDSGVNVHQAGTENACETLVMANAAHVVAQHIEIPPVPVPAPQEEVVPPGVIMAQFLALEKEQRFKLHERYCINRVSHKLTFAVLQQLTHEMRQDAAWREFLRAAGGPPGLNNNKRNKSKREAKVTYAAFAGVAQQLGISMPPKKLQAVARSLDPWKTGFVSWESFCTWWISL